MYYECRHILLSGHKCRAAAVRGKAFCYHHMASRRLARTTLTATDPLMLPSVEDPAGLIAAVNQVIRHYGDSHIDRDKAGTLFYGLQVATSILKASLRSQPPGQTVRDVIEDEEEGLIAPESTSCEPPQDCEDCERRNTCKTRLVSESEFPGDFFSPPPNYTAKAARNRLGRDIAKDLRLDEERREIFRRAYGDDKEKGK
ncbi:hypothetical protein [Occallatibacter savannae]|uniref:hypothetical protein n=1 Tax=Occallatibacter savannae TaxID=1002691 RepID=UPI0013A58DD3|nr:hypothetical protein [Occallatibacter savannae]